MFAGVPGSCFAGTMMFNGIPHAMMVLQGRVFVWLVPLQVVLNEGVKPQDMLKWLATLSVSAMARIRKKQAKAVKAYIGKEVELCSDRTAKGW